MLHVYLLGSDRIRREQLAAADKFSALNECGEPQVYADPMAARDSAWADRPAGQRLLDGVRSGDHVVVPDGSAVYTRRAEFADAVLRLLSTGATVHILKPGLSITPDQAELLRAALLVFNALDRAGRSEAIRAGLAERRRSGGRWAHHPGYGWRWSRGRRVPDPDERAAIACIRGWRADGYTVEAIYHHLRKHGVKTRAGRQWSRNRIKRVTTCATQVG